MVFKGNASNTTRYELKAYNKSSGDIIDSYKLGDPNNKINSALDRIFSHNNDIYVNGVSGDLYRLSWDGSSFNKIWENHNETRGVVAHIDSNYIYMVGQYLGNSTLTKINKDDGTEEWQTREVREIWPIKGLGGERYEESYMNEYKIKNNYLYYEENTVYNINSDYNRIVKVDLSSGSVEVVSDHTVHAEIGYGPINNNLIVVSEVSRDTGGLVKVDMTKETKMLGDTSQELLGNSFVQGIYRSEEFSYDNRVTLNNISINISNFTKNKNKAFIIIVAINDSESIDYKFEDLSLNPNIASNKLDSVYYLTNNRVNNNLDGYNQIDGIEKSYQFNLSDENILGEEDTTGKNVRVYSSLAYASPLRDKPVIEKIYINKSE
jgi:hypothetical protein